MSIYFHNETCRFKYNEIAKSKKWLRKILREEQKKESDINIIFSDNHTILQLNKTYLSRNYFTDVIAFPYAEGKTVAGDIYISIDTVKENAKHYKCTFWDELHRVMIHGLLHLIGYGDKTAKEKKEMREKESFYLSEFKS